MYHRPPKMVSNNKKNKLPLSIQPDIKFDCDDWLPNDDFIVLLYNIIFIVSFWSFFVKMFELNTIIKSIFIIHDYSTKIVYML
jgi:hypothetical protein